MIRRKLQRKEDGVIIIEASIILPIFMFVFLTFYSIVNLCVLEAKVQTALRSTAKQISTYSYFYAFSGAKAKVDELEEFSQKTKDDINKNVIGNISTFMGAVEDIGGTAEAAKEDFEKNGLDPDVWADLKEKAENVGSDLNSAKGAALDLVSYIRSNLGSPSDIKNFAFSLMKMMASDGIGIAKNVLGSFLAEELCKASFTSESDRAFFEKIDFSKSMLFPGTSSDIAVIAEYKVRIVPYIPVKLYYTISQQAVTTGWLSGDGGTVEKSGLEIVPIPQKENNIWTKEGNTTERSKKIRDDRISYYVSAEKGYKYTSKTNMIYNPSENKFILIASSNPLYGKGPGEGIDKEQVKDMLLTNIAKMKEIHSSERYREKDEEGNITRSVKFYPYQNGDLKRTIELTIPTDTGLEEEIRSVWSELGGTEGIELVFNPGYGSNYSNGEGD